MQRNGGRLAIIFLVALLFVALVPLSAVAAMSVNVSPTSGNVGDTVSVSGFIDTKGGKFGVTFDSTLVAWGSAPANSQAIASSFMVRARPGSDLGVGYTVKLSDNATKNTATATFDVLTARSVAVDQGRIQEGVSDAITVSVTGGIAGLTYTYNLDLKDAQSKVHSAKVSFAVISDGSGSGSASYPADFSASPNTNFVGRYSIQANETSPGKVTGPTASFAVGLLGSASYERFQQANIKSTGWQPKEELKLDIKNAAGQSVKIGSVQYPQTLNADSSGALPLNPYMTAALPVDFPLGRYAVTVANSTNGGFKGTVKSPADADAFQATVSTAISVAIKGQPAGAYQRTQTASLLLNITYPDRSAFTDQSLGSITVGVFNATHTHLADIALAAANFDKKTLLWTASWKVPVGAVLQSDHFMVMPGDVKDKFSNDNSAQTGPVMSSAFIVNLATLDVTILSQWKGGATFLRGMSASMDFKVEYPDKSLLTPDLLGSTGLVAVNVSFGGVKYNIVNLTVNQGVTFANGVWTAAWTIPPTAGLTTSTSTEYLFIIRTSFVSDGFGNSNTLDSRSNLFDVLAFAPAIPTTSVDVQVDVGSIHVRGEMAQFTILTAVGGQAMNMDSVTARLRSPDGTSASMSVTKVDVGLYSVTYSIPSNAAAGAYTLVVNAIGTVPFGGSTIGVMGIAVKSFLVSPLLSDINARLTTISNGVATIQTSVGSIQVDIAAIKPVITSINNGVVTLQTSVGTIQADVSAIRPIVTRIDGNVATVQTDVGTLKGTVTSISGDVATIKTGVGDLQARLPTDVARTGTVSNVLNLLYVVTALALVAALGAIAAVAVISRRLTK